jgi:hypothetical protein
VKILNQNIRWAGQTYRAPAGDDGGDGGGGDGGGDDGGGDGGDDGAGGDGGGDDAAATAAAAAAAAAGGDDTWRDRYNGYAGEGEDYSKLTGRFTDEAAFVKNAVQANEKLRAGEISTGLPAEPTEEQLNDYRVAQGIPLDGKYDLTLPTGRELTDVDVEMMAPVMAYAHENNIPQEQLVGLMDTYLAESDKIVEQMHTQDNLDAQQFTKVAKENWGPEYQINMNRVNNQINMLPEDVREGFKQARMPDGRGLMNSPEVMNWLVGVDRQLKPMDPMPGGTESTLNDARKVVEASKERMANDSVAWHKDQPAQKAYMQAQSAIDQFEGSQ